MPGKGSQATGRAAEDLALRFLRARGLDLVERNYRCRGGEIDLVMRDGRHWVFVEVRYRRRQQFGAPQATVDTAKQRRLTLAASHFLVRHGDAPARFDVVGISGEPPRIEWIRNAFEGPAYV
jgi:putative endonuclease